MTTAAPPEDPMDCEGKLSGVAEVVGLVDELSLASPDGACGGDSVKEKVLKASCYAAKVT